MAASSINEASVSTIEDQSDPSTPAVAPAESESHTRKRRYEDSDEQSEADVKKTKANSATDGTVADLHAKLHRHVLSERQLRTEGYPYRERGAVTFTITTTKFKDSPLIRKKGNQRVCRRCSEVFRVGEDGLPTVKEPCSYHVGRYLKFQDSYTCCNRQNGCQTADKHVHMYNFYNDTSGYVETRHSQSTPPNVYALDCEMVYTRAGYEVVRAVVVDAMQNVVLNEHIQPGSPVVDWNTRFTGMTAEDLPKLTISLEDFQKKLLDIVCDKSILVGHSLDMDLIVLKVIHKRVIDTSVLYPDGRGRKRSLKNLAESKLNKTIQREGVAHDCAEDALAALQIALYKIGAFEVSWDPYF